VIIIIIIIIIIKNEKIRVTLCENAAGALYIVNKMCVDGQRNDWLERLVSEIIIIIITLVYYAMTDRNAVQIKYQ